MIIIGSGAGGGTLARHLAPSGKRILILERGGWLPRELENWNAEAVFMENRYVPKETWYDNKERPSSRGSTTAVGGATKLYGAALYRLRREDFGELRHYDGVSPAWPISYDEMEPYYTGRSSCTRCTAPAARTPPSRRASAPYPFPAVSHEPRIQQLPDDLERAGYHPFHAPYGVGCSRTSSPTAPASGARRATASRASSRPSRTPRCSGSARPSSTPTSRS